MKDRSLSLRVRPDSGTAEAVGEEGTEKSLATPRFLASVLEHWADSVVVQKPRREATDSVEARENAILQSSVHQVSKRGGAKVLLDVPVPARDFSGIYAIVRAKPPEQVPVFGTPDVRRVKNSIAGSEASAQ